MSIRDPDLFDGEPRGPARATIIAWPLDRDVGRVRHVARLLTAKPTEKQRDTYWRTTCNRLAGVLLKNGLTENDIERQLGRFQAAVGLELVRQAHLNGREQA